MHRNVVAFDLSFTAPGWAWFDHLTNEDRQRGAVSNVVSGTLRPTKYTGTDPLSELYRLDWIRTECLSIIPPDALVVVEDFAFSRANQAHQIGGLQYCFRLSLWKRGVPFILVAPSRLKKFVTGTGNAEKSLMLQQVYKRWGIECKDDNEADAVGLCYVGMAMLGMWEPQTAQQREVVAAMRQAFAHVFPPNKVVT